MHTDARLLRRLAIAGVCALSVLAACGLAYWQWERYSATGGSMQNLGYVLQWPVFGLFPAFVFWRIRRLSQAGERAEPDTRDGSQSSVQRGSGPDRTATQRRAASSATTRAALSRAATSPSTRQVSHTSRVTDEEQDEELAAYNRYLAELNARDRHND